MFTKIRYETGVVKFFLENLEKINSPALDMIKTIGRDVVPEQRERFFEGLDDRWRK